MDGKEFPLDGPYSIQTELQKLVGPALLSGDGIQPLCRLRSGRQIRGMVTECRGDWKWQKEVLNSALGWNGASLCFHCMVQKDNYAVFPGQLGQRERRSLASFKDACKEDSDGCKSFLKRN